MRALQKKEFQEFGQFVEAQCHHHNQNLIIFYQFLEQYKPLFDSSDLEKEIIYSKFYPKEKYSEQKLRYAMTDLTKLLEEFFIHKELEHRQDTRAHLLLDAYQKRGVDKYFLQFMEKYRKLSRLSAIPDLSYYLNNFLLEMKSSTFEFTRTNDAKPAFIIQLMKYLDIFYFSNKLKYACEIKNYRNVMKVDYDPIFMDYVLAEMKKSDLLETPILKIYYLILQTLNDPDEFKHFNALKEELFENSLLFEKEESENMFVYARNFCINNINRANSEHDFLGELFELYKEILDKEIIIKNNELSQWDYKNIVTLGLRMKNNEFVKTFILKYRKYLKGDAHKNAFSYNLAKFHFYNEEFEKAIELLQEVDINDPYYHVEVKTLMLKVYYELNEIISLFSLFDSFKIYIVRNKVIPDNRKLMLKNLIKYAKKLVRVKMGSKMNVDKIKEQLAVEKNTLDIAWLIRKADELAVEK